MLTFRKAKSNEGGAVFYKADGVAGSLKMSKSLFKDGNSANAPESFDLDVEGMTVADEKSIARAAKKNELASTRLERAQARAQKAAERAEKARLTLERAQKSAGVAGPKTASEVDGSIASAAVSGAANEATVETV